MTTPSSAISNNVPIPASIHSTPQSWYEWVVDHPIITVVMGLLGALFLYAMIDQQNKKESSDPNAFRNRSYGSNPPVDDLKELKIIQISQRWFNQNLEKLTVKINDKDGVCLVERFFDELDANELQLEIATHLPISMDRWPMSLQFNFDRHIVAGPELTPQGEGIALYQIEKDKTVSIPLEFVKKYEWRPDSPLSLGEAVTLDFANSQIQHVVRYPDGSGIVLHFDNETDYKIVEIKLLTSSSFKSSEGSLYYPVTKKSASVSFEKIRRDWASVYAMQTGEISQDYYPINIVSVKIHTFR